MWYYSFNFINSITPRSYLDKSHCGLSIQKFAKYAVSKMQITVETF